MTSSATVNVIICVVGVVLVGALLAPVIAGRRSPSRRAQQEPRRGRVQGGTHLGGGRSVAPRRDGEITPEDSPDEPTVQVRKRNSPMDL